MRHLDSQWRLSIGWWLFLFVEGLSSYDHRNSVVEGGRVRD